MNAQPHIDISLKHEYRTRLTADLVTGKLDVREAAAKLPDAPSDTAAERAPRRAAGRNLTQEIEA